MTHVLTRLIDRLTGHTRVTVMETERLLVLERGRIATILSAGEHRLKRKDTVTERHDLNRLRFTTPYEAALFRERPDLAEAHLTEVRAGEDEVLIVRRDGRLHGVVLAGDREVLWTDAGPWAVERLTLTDTLAVERKLGKALVRAGLGHVLTIWDVAEGHVGLLTVDGVLKGRLEPGTHAFWHIGRGATVRMIDLRMRTHEVTGQEILTKDRVTIRVNLTAVYRVTDPERAVAAVKDYTEALHRALQLAFRRTLGALTLDTILAEKGAVNADAAEAVRAEMARIGIEVGEIALRDVILPGEMREILNRVVTAEKEAEANVIRRREETNATRALLNTAKVMAENPVMLRLKELEALEAIAGKVERLTVHNGTEGLMTDLVKLRE
ncbi:slipin family protein [Roseovarius faecimaris]|uniref:Slipin family protein n=1 Tax=Roseovarius faecimaris TaxID=2494550 RepID=A0A6I6IPQ9_9RHOB|nr:slipin family protein [Roseovarius faecimaris]QGX97447.1 slipin family protein [Roseovarius faecimaris]